MVHVHPVRGEVAQAPVAPSLAPFLHSPAEPSRSVPAVRPSSSPCPPRADVRTTLVRPVVSVAAPAVRGGLGAVDTAHVRPPVVVLDGWATGWATCRSPWAACCWASGRSSSCPPPDLNRGTLRIAYGSPRGGRYRAPLPLGQRAWSSSWRSWTSRGRRGDRTNLQPCSAPARGGYWWAVRSPRVAS